MKRGELDDLLAFAAIARARSFTRAAAELNLSPSALSHTMKALETRLGVQLLVRTTRSVAATPAGERLLQSVESAVRQVETGLSALGDWQSAPSGAIRLTAFTYAAQTVLSSELPKFLLKYPKVSVEVVVDGRPNNIVDDGFDAGIRFGDSVEKDMIAVRIGPDIRTVIVGSPAYFEEYKRPITPADLDLHNCINYRRVGSGGLMTWDFIRDGKEIRARPKGQLVVGGADLAVAAVLAGAGLGYVLEEHASPYLKTGRLVQVLDDWCAPFPGLHIYYPSRHVSPALRALVDVLRMAPSTVSARPSGSASEPCHLRNSSRLVDEDQPFRFKPHLRLALCGPFSACRPNAGSIRAVEEGCSRSHKDHASDSSGGWRTFKVSAARRKLGVAKRTRSHRVKALLD